MNEKIVLHCYNIHTCYVMINVNSPQIRTWWLTYLVKENLFLWRSYITFVDNLLLYCIVHTRINSIDATLPVYNLIFFFLEISYHWQSFSFMFLAPHITFSVPLSYTDMITHLISVSLKYMAELNGPTNVSVLWACCTCACVCRWMGRQRWQVTLRTPQMCTSICTSYTFTPC